MTTTQAEMLEMIDDEPNNEQMRMFGNSPFNDVLKALEAKANSNREKGDLFEALTKAFLEQDSLYKEQFTEVWLWNDWPHRAGRPDTGIDLVAQNSDDGEFTAIQCKCQGRRQNIPVGRSKSVPPERSLASVNVRASCSGEVSQRQAGSRLGE